MNSEKISSGWVKSICDDCGLSKDTTQCKDIQYRCNECREKYLYQKRLQKIEAIIPPKFLNIQTNKKEFQQYKELPTSLFIYGKSGTGKTVFACSLAKEYILKGLKVDFISYPAFIMDLQGAFKKEGEFNDPYETAKNKAHFEGVLIIDDLGAEKLTEFVRQITYFLINEREQYLLTTIITSNFSLQELDTQIDTRVASRIAGMCKVLNFQGKDLRVKNV